MMCKSYGFVTETMVTRKCLNFMSYEHCLSCLYFDFLLRSLSGLILVGVPGVVRGPQLEKPCCRIISIIVECLCLHCSVQGEDPG